jgi:hypothetical protein
MTTNHRNLSLKGLSRRPVLVAMIVYSMAYGIATYAMWREATSASSHRTCEKRFLVQASAATVRQTEDQKRVQAAAFL